MSPLSPWQRVMVSRNFSRPIVYRAPGPIPTTPRLPPIHVFDDSMSPDAFYWAAEEEIEKWSDFILEMKERRKT